VHWRVIRAAASGRNGTRWEPIDWQARRSADRTASSCSRSPCSGQIPRAGACGGWRRPFNGEPIEEAAWRSQWISADIPAERRERIVKRQAAPPDLVVVQPVKDWVCAECGGTGDLLIMDDKGPLCLTCADMDHLVFLPSGDAALTRRAKKASTLSAVVVRWSKTRKRYERQGLLVEEPALGQAEEQCLGDSDARMRRRERGAERRAGEDLQLQARFVAEMARLFPGCPAERAEAIARHTGARGSGRVGRSAAGRSLDEKAVTLAVVASVRHEDTEYDSLLMSGVPRDEARDRIRPDIDRVLDDWAAPRGPDRRAVDHYEAIEPSG
jgi:hypothetical protein